MLAPLYVSRSSSICVNSTSILSIKAYAFCSDSVGWASNGTQLLVSIDDWWTIMTYFRNQRKCHTWLLHFDANSTNWVDFPFWKILQCLLHKQTVGYVQTECITKTIKGSIWCENVQIVSIIWKENWLGLYVMLVGRISLFLDGRQFKWHLQ